MLQTLLHYIHPALALLIIAMSALVFGTALLGQRIHFANRLEHALIAMTLGVGVIAQGLFVLGLLGALNRFWVLTTLLLAHLACYRTWRRLWILRHGPRVSWVIGGVAALLFLPSYLLTHYPPTGFDATVYHLPYVKAFLAAERLVFVEDLRFPIFPQVGEMGFVLAFLLEGETTAKLSHWLCSLLVAGLLWIWRRARVSGWAVALWLGTPLVVWISVQAYIDLSLTLFVTASILAWTRWRSNRDPGWIVLAGLFAGLAAGTKYLALFWILILGVLALVEAFKRRQIRPLLLVILATSIMMAPWYLRLIHQTGNPVFPFYAPIFGASEWTSAHDRSLPQASEEQAGVGAVGSVAKAQLSKIVSGLQFLAFLPWNAVFERHLFHDQAPLSPFYLLLIPLALPFALGDRRTRGLLFGLLLYALFWLTTVRDLRFLLPAMPLFHLALATGFDRLYQRWQPLAHRYSQVALLIFFLLPGWGYGVYKLVERGPIPITVAEREAYLVDKVPGYVAVQRLNHNAGESFSAYALFGEPLHYHAQGRLQGDWFGPANYWRILAVIDKPAELHRRLRDLDVCDLILVDGPRPIELPSETDFFELVERWEEVELYQLAGCEAGTSP